MFIIPHLSKIEDTSSLEHRIWEAINLKSMKQSTVFSHSSIPDWPPSQPCRCDQSQTRHLLDTRKDNLRTSSHHYHHWLQGQRSTNCINCAFGPFLPPKPPLNKVSAIDFGRQLLEARCMGDMVGHLKMVLFHITEPHLRFGSSLCTADPAFSFSSGIPAMYLILSIYKIESYSKDRSALHFIF